LSRDSRGGADIMGRRIIPNREGGQSFRPERRRFRLFWGKSGCALAVLVVGLTACSPKQQANDTQFVGGPFVLTDQNGARETQAVLGGKWTLVFFGYTFCPDVCPVTLSNLGAAIARMGPDAGSVRVVFITVDPERDTPAQLKSYLSSPSFPRGTLGLTGTSAQVAAVAHAYHVYYRKAGNGPGYSVDHTSVVYLMNPRGRFDRPVDVSLPPDGVARQIQSAMRGA
jgi:protein SCO1/2